jgi:hypothetical protein
VSPAERIEINFPEPRQDRRVLKLTCRGMAGASPAFDHDWTYELHGLQVAFRIAINCDDDMIGH